MEIKPFEHMRITTTAADEKNTAALLDKTKKRQGLICQKCGATRIIVEAFVKARLEILNESTVAIVMGMSPETAYVNKIVECAICRSTEVSSISIP